MIERRSERVTTNIFSLNSTYGEAVISQSFITPLIGVVPQLVEWNLDLAVDPSGSRHLQTSPAFKQMLSSGVNSSGTNLGPFDMSATNVSSGVGISCTRCMMFRADQFECSTTRISNMKVWAADLGDFLVPEAFEVIYDTRQTPDYPSGFQFGPENITNKPLHLPKSLPETQNLRRQDGAFTIHGSGDNDVSEYMLFSVAASGCLPLGEYVGNPGFQLRVTYNVDNISDLFD